MHLANRTMMHLNHFQVGTEEMHIWRSSSYHMEGFLIYNSVWKSWMPLYLPHFHGPLVNMASISVTSLYSCPSFLHPTSLTRIENALQLFSISEEGTELLIPNWAHPRESTLCNEEVLSTMTLSSPPFLLVIFVSSLIIYPNRVTWSTARIISYELTIWLSKLSFDWSNFYWHYAFFFPDSFYWLSICIHFSYAEGWHWQHLSEPWCWRPTNLPLFL